MNLQGPANQWWAYVPGADWRHPTCLGSSLKGMANHLVVHVTAADVAAYTAWVGASLPTEAEREYAARGGIYDASYAWGDSFLINGQHMANTWRSSFPYTKLCEVGWGRTSPIGSFAPNGHGLVDMIGNVWEWTADWWSVASR